jgi:hypothetical protein
MVVVEKGISGVCLLDAEAAALYFMVFARELILFEILSPKLAMVPTMVKTMRAAATAYSDSSNPLSSLRNLLITSVLSFSLEKRWSGLCNLLCGVNSPRPSFHLIP